jgi:Uncharacterised protein family (UPF0158)
MKGAEVLDPQQVDLADLAIALEDHSQEHTWWLDPASGAVEPRFGDADGRDDGVRAIPVEPLPTAVAYADMEAFVARVRDPRARYALDRAIAGRGAFRRFKDALLDYPELRRAWFRFHDGRSERRAIEWLVEHELVEPDAAEQALARNPDPGVTSLPGLLDAEGVAHRVARDLRRHYGDRLRTVLLTGLWAHGEPHPESELELLVVLDDVPDRWAEKAEMDRILWRHSMRHDTVVTGTPVTDRQLRGSASPLLARARTHGVRVV